MDDYRDIIKKYFLIDKRVKIPKNTKKKYGKNIIQKKL